MQWSTLLVDDTSNNKGPSYRASLLKALLSDWICAESNITTCSKHNYYEDAILRFGASLVCNWAGRLPPIPQTPNCCVSHVSTGSNCVTWMSKYFCSALTNCWSGNMPPRAKQFLFCTYRYGRIVYPRQSCFVRLTILKSRNHGFHLGYGSNPGRTSMTIPGDSADG